MDIGSTLRLMMVSTCQISNPRSVYQQPSCDARNPRHVRGNFVISPTLETSIALRHS